MTIESLAKKIEVCTKCQLWESRKFAVPGEGNPEADIFLIGEGPGDEEDRTGRPFVGRAGKLLDEMLVSVKLERQNLFITNVVKCHPPKNRIPKDFEIRTCTSNYLFNQIKLTEPKIIVLLGLTSLRVFFPNKKLQELHGKYLKKDNHIFLVLYHPALILHRPDLKSVLQKDIKALFLN